MSDLTTLAMECERAEGASYDLDCRIHQAIGGTVPSGFQMQYEGTRVPAYTASLDAAMSLVPEGWGVDIFAGVTATRVKPSASVWYPGASSHEADAATPALALTAACLRVRAG